MGFQEMKLACVLALALCAVAAPVEAASLEKTDKAVESAPKSDLGESTGNMFSGALLTSGSFTMMASAGYEEEEELGEGEGTGNMFSGALLTSGSFTMMASAGY